jgi:general secretion pathway protein D
MTLNKYLLTTIAIFSSFTTFSAELNCNDISGCLKEYSNISGEKYLIPNKVKGKDFQINLSGDKKKIDFALSFLLNQNGYTRVKQPETDLTVIIPTRDIRYNPTPLISSDNIGKVPKNYDYFMIKHKLKNKILGKDITRSLRPFMSRYGRIIINQTPGIITLQDTGVNIHRLLELIKDYDAELSQDEIKDIKRRQKEDQRHHRRVEMLKAKHTKSKH